MQHGSLENLFCCWFKPFSTRKSDGLFFFCFQNLNKAEAKETSNEEAENPSNEQVVNSINIPENYIPKPENEQTINTKIGGNVFRHPKGAPPCATYFLGAPITPSTSAAKYRLLRNAKLCNSVPGDGLCCTKRLQRLHRLARMAV